MKKGFVFLFLFVSFLAYSILVYTKGTKAKGAAMNAEAVRGKSYTRNTTAQPVTRSMDLVDILVPI